MLARGAAGLALIINSLHLTKDGATAGVARATSALTRGRRDQGGKLRERSGLLYLHGGAGSGAATSFLLGVTEAFPFLRLATAGATAG